MPNKAYSKLIYFDNYEDNRKAFLELSLGYKKTSWPLITDTSLTTDLTLVKNISADSIVVLSSGLHGIEGYVGSSVQRWLLSELKNIKKLKSDILLVHALNPWGMKYKRRVNENNIDLNRNFSNSQSLYLQKNKDYLKLDSFLNPDIKLEMGTFHRLGFVISAPNC